jgi:hypothetical protein
MSMAYRAKLRSAEERFWRRRRDLRGARRLN